MSTISESEVAQASEVALATTDRLSGRMGTTALVLSVLAFSSPLTSAAGYLAFVIASVGNTAPLAFLATTVLLLIFTAGYMAISTQMPRPGAFYAYISIGLGRQVGLGSALVALVSYTLILIGVYFFAGTVVSDIVERLGGPHLDWWVGAVAVWAIVALLGYANVDISAKVLVWVMVVEIAMVLIFNIGVVLKGGAHGLSATPFSLTDFASSGAVNISMLFTVLTYIGFEATALYRDEVKDPEITIPRATYISVIFIGLFYALTTWALIMAFGDQAQSVAVANASKMFTQAADTYLGSSFTQVTNLLLLTAVMAALVSIHNASTRYLFNLSADGALPKALSIVHARLKSPARSSLTVSVIVLVVFLFFKFKGSDPSLLYGQFAGLGSTGVIFLMALLSISVIVWFSKKESEDRGHYSKWKTVIAPLISAISMSAIFVYVILNFEQVAGGSPGENLSLLLILAAAFVGGLVIASVLKKNRPDQYLRLGGSTR